MKDAPQSNHMNNLLTDMYRTNAAESRGAAAQNDFPIDISSDESDIDEPIQKSTNNGKQYKIVYFTASYLYPSILLCVLYKKKSI